MREGGKQRSELPVFLRQILKSVYERACVEQVSC